MCPCPWNCSAALPYSMPALLYLSALPCPAQAAPCVRPALPCAPSPACPPCHALCKQPHACHPGCHPALTRWTCGAACGPTAPASPQSSHTRCSPDRRAAITVGAHRWGHDARWRAPQPRASILPRSCVPAPACRRASSTCALAEKSVASPPVDCLHPAVTHASPACQLTRSPPKPPWPAPAACAACSAAAVCSTVSGGCWLPSIALLG